MPSNKKTLSEYKKAIKRAEQKPEQKTVFSSFVNCMAQAVALEQKKQQQLVEQRQQKEQQKILEQQKNQEEVESDLSILFETIQKKLQEQHNSSAILTEEESETTSTSSLSASEKPKQEEEKEEISSSESSSEPNTGSEKTSSPTNAYVGELEKTFKSDKITTPEQEEDTKVRSVVSDQLNQEINKIRQLFPNFGMSSGSGGGTNAIQYGEGGTMNGDLNVTGKYLSAGVDLSDIFSSGGGPGGPTDKLTSGTQNIQLSSNGMLVFTVTNDNIIFTTPLGQAWTFDNTGMLKGPGTNGNLNVYGIDSKNVILSGGINLSDIFLQKGVIDGGIYF